MTGFRNKKKKYQKHQRLPCAIQRNLQTELKENKKTSESLIPIGTRVFTRNRISGRNKIQDTWCSIPYKVVIYFGDTCVIYTAGGQIRPVQECDKEEDPGH